jgi:YqaJ-like viral recombinase domain
MRVIECEQGSAQWLAERAGKATASEFASVMAKIKSGEAAERKNYRTRLVVERLTGKPIPTFQSAAMRQGTEREPDARMAYMIKTGAVVDQVGFCAHDTLSAGASPDGLIGADGGLEIKCPELSAHLEYLKLDREPKIYSWQIQGCMWITGRSWWDFVSYNPDFPEQLQLCVRRVQRDMEAIDLLEREVEKFLLEVDQEELLIRNLGVAT